MTRLCTHDGNSRERQAPRARQAARKSATPLEHTAGGLNDRQRAYLLAAFDLDQQAERDNRHFHAPPAKLWRWIEYGPIGQRKLLGSGPLREQLLQLRLVGAGAGATWSRLEHLGLVLLKHEPSGFQIHGRSIPILLVQLTRLGRNVCRQLLGRPLTKPGKADKPLSLTALRLLDFGQRHPGKRFSWSAPWDEVQARLPEAPIVWQVSKGLIRRGLLTGDPHGNLELTEAGRNVDVATQPSWIPFRDLTPGREAPKIAGRP